VVRETFILRPPMSSRPMAKIAPSLVIWSPCVLTSIYSIDFLKSANLGYELLVDTCNNNAREM
jgi:acyl-CoA hydrolase